MKTVTLTDSPGIIVGDMVSFPMRRRKWWQFWKKRHRIMRVVSVSANTMRIE